MIFSLTLDTLLRGLKTQTRRIAKPHEFLIQHGDMRRVESKTDKSHRVLYQVGKTYAVQPGPAKKAAASIVMRGIREEAVADISEADARAEGFASREDFFDTWQAIHGANADLQQRVWVLEFELLSVDNKEQATAKDAKDTKRNNI